MPYITYRYKVRGGCQHLYALGDRDAVVQALHDTFNNHGMPIHSEKNQMICHYPSGWLNRINTAIERSSFMNGDLPESDCFSVTYKATSNPLVTKLFVRIYHKTGWFRDSKVQARIKGFYEAFEHEIQIYRIPIIDADHWSEFVAQYPQFYCYPVWRTTDEREEDFRNLEAQLKAKHEKTQE